MIFPRNSIDFNSIPFQYIGNHWIEIRLNENQILQISRQIVLSTCKQAIKSFRSMRSHSPDLIRLLALLKYKDIYDAYDVILNAKRQLRPSEKQLVWLHSL